MLTERHGQRRARECFRTGARNAQRGAGAGGAHRRGRGPSPRHSIWACSSRFLEICRYGKMSRAGQRCSFFVSGLKTGELLLLQGMSWSHCYTQKLPVPHRSFTSASICRSRFRYPTCDSRFQHEIGILSHNYVHHSIPREMSIEHPP
ncbi:hypothetical protein MPTK2_7g03240 [Marchantia polymorpha subsp. ruderalis]